MLFVNFHLSLFAVVGGRDLQCPASSDFAFVKLNTAFFETERLMTGYTVNTGSSKKFASGWDNVFSGAKTKKKAAKKKVTKKAKKVTKRKK